jgi:hypothetical protein
MRKVWALMEKEAAHRKNNSNSGESEDATTTLAFSMRQCLNNKNVDEKPDGLALKGGKSVTGTVLSIVLLQMYGTYKRNETIDT